MGRIEKKVKSSYKKWKCTKKRKNVEKCIKKIIKRKDLKKNQNQNKNPLYGKK